MNTHIIISIDKRRAKKDGTFPIIFRITHKRDTISIPSGFSCKESDWDEKRKSIKNSFKGVDSNGRLNNLLQAKKSELFTKVTKLYEQGKLNSMSISDLKTYLMQSESSNASFLDYTEEQIELLKTSGRHGSARAYYSMFLVIKKFNKGKDLRFDELNLSFLKRLEVDYLSRGNALNGLAAILRSVRAVYNKAVQDNKTVDLLYPFKDYKIRKTPTVKRAISSESINKVIKLQLAQDDSCFHARNYFVFSYLMFGMNFSDMAWLQVENIIDGRIKYIRKKTKHAFDIKILDSAMPILAFYMENKKPEDFVFPIIKREDLGDIEKDIQDARKMYNKRLKKVASMCGIAENLTSYVSRHSAATAALNLGIPIVAISQLLGHSNLSVTQTYLKSLPDSVIDSYHEKLVTSASISSI